MRFAIFTNVQHYRREGNFYAYSPYIREMKLWLRNVEEVEVVAPAPPPPKGELTGQESYRHKNLTFSRIPSFHFLSLIGAVKAILKIPYIIYKILGAMKKADHLHLRCPGNIGLLACMCQIFFPSKPKSAKYAGNWDPGAKQPWTYRFQKWLLSNTFLTRNMQVLVYGEWPGQSKNVIPFFTASFSEKEKTEVPKKAFSGPFIFLFVGNLVEGKRPLEAVKLVESINAAFGNGSDQEIRASLEIYGDGLERKKLETYIKENCLEELISFKGNRSLEELKYAYKTSHFVILPSKSEGWPKALAEGMFFGCIPIATSVSCVPWMLNNGSRGILLGEYKNQDLLRSNIDKVELLLKDSEEMKRMSEEAKKWSQQYTLERFEVAIQEVLLNTKEDRVNENEKLSPTPFRDGVKRGKSEE